MGKVAIIADKDTAEMFKLGGIKSSYGVESQEEAQKVLLDIVRKEEFVAVFIAERLAEVLQPLILKISSQSKYPIIVGIPAKEGFIGAEVDPVFERIKNVLGVELKAKK